MTDNDASVNADDAVDDNTHYYVAEIKVKMMFLIMLIMTYDVEIK